MLYSPSTGIWCPPRRGIERYSTMPAPVQNRRRAGYSGKGPPLLPGTPTAYYLSTVGVYHDSGLTTLATNGQSVGGWKDQSGNGNHLTGGSPIFNTNYINGQPAIVPSACGTDYLQASFTLAQPYQIYLVMQNISYVCQWAMDGLANRAGLVMTGTNTISMVGSSTQPAITLNSGSWGIVQMLWDDPNSSIQISNGSPVVANTGASSPNGLLLFSNHTNYSGDANIAIAGAVVYAYQQGSSEKMAVIAALNGIFGV